MEKEFKKIIKNIFRYEKSQDLSHLVLKYPKTWEILYSKKIDYDTLYLFLKSLNIWLDGDFEDMGKGRELNKTQEKLYSFLLSDDFKKIFRFYENLNKSPGFLYRGIRYSGSLPKKEQKVFYTSKFTKISSWSEKESIAREFIGASDIVLKVDFKNLSSENIIMYPVSLKNELSNIFNVKNSLIADKEWILDSRKKFPVEILT